jgi:hypothetical protein
VHDLARAVVDDVRDVAQRAQVAFDRSNWPSATLANAVYSASVPNIHG